MAKKDRGKSGSGGGNGSGRSAHATVHELPTGARARPTPGKDPVAFPNVPTIVEISARAAVAANQSNLIVAWNAAAVELFGFTEDEVLGKNLQLVIQARDVHGNRLSVDHGAFHDMIRIGEAPNSFELAIITATGKMLRVAVSIMVVLGAKKTDYNAIYLMTPMHRRRRADEAIDRLLAQVNIPGVTVPGATSPSGADQRGSRPKPRLTRRQLEVLLLMAEGKHSGEIATELGISVHTVRTLIQGILRTLGATNRLEAVSRALQESII